MVKEASLNLTRQRASRITVPAALGRLLLENKTGGDVDLQIDRRDVGKLAAGASRSFSLEEGSHRIQAHYQVLGRELELEDRSVQLTESSSRSLVLRAPSRGLVRVENNTGRAGYLVVDGERERMLDPGEVVIVELPVGVARLSLKHRERSVFSETVEVRPFQAAFFTPEILTGELRVENPLRIPVRVELEGEQARLVEPRSSVLFRDLVEGRLTVRFETLDGLKIEGQSIRIRAGGRRSIEIPEPTLAQLELQSDSPRPADVYVDSTLVGSLGARGDLRLILEPGTHRVQVRDPAGRLLLDRRVQVDVYETLTLRVEVEGVAHSETSSEHIRPGDVPSGRVYVVN